MIIDSLNSSDRYCSLHPLFPEAFEFLRAPGIAGLAEGRYELVGDRLVALVVRKGGKSREEAVLEGHLLAIDIHFLIEGREAVGWKAVSDCAVVRTAYEEASDSVFYADAPATWVDIPAGSFAIFFPGDAHAAMVSSGLVHKVVLKVRSYTKENAGGRGDV
jgi:YhcH/YjgK/YiaL family protein